MYLEPQQALRFALMGAVLSTTRVRSRDRRTRAVRRGAVAVRGPDVARRFERRRVLRPAVRRGVPGWRGCGRALIFRYDSGVRRVRAAGAHGLSLEQFAGAYVTVESAPIAAQSLREDRVIEIEGDMFGQFPEEYASVFPEPVRLVCAPMTAAGRAVGVIFADRLLSEPAARRLRAASAVDARQDGGARVGRCGSWPSRPRRLSSSSSGSISLAKSTKA